MKKSGLHKQITSIFNRVPELKEQAKEGQEHATGSDFAAESKPVPVKQPVAQKPEPQQGETVQSAPGTAKSTRPMPIPKHTVSAALRPQRSKLADLKKSLTGDSSNPRQRKTAILAGMLVVVFTGVLFISLGGIGGSGSKKPLQKPDEKTAKASSGAVDKAASWKMPEPLPATMRDPMRPGNVPTAEGVAVAAATGELVVKGIVFSYSRPSALINNEIVREGQVIDGVTVVRIDRTEVEFELSGKRWKQQVKQ